MRHLAASTAVLVVIALAGACSAGDDPGTGPAPTSAPTSGSPSETGPGSPGPTATGGTGVAPATGPVLRMPHSSVRIPSGWRTESQLVPTQRDASDQDTVSIMKLGEINAFGRTFGADAAAETALRVIKRIYPLQPKRLPNVEVDGTEMYHLSGRIQPLNWLEEYGAVVDDRIVTLTFQFSPEVSAGERREIADSVLATFRWA